MNNIKLILVIVDPLAEKQACVDKAAVLALKFGARVELLICDTKIARQQRALAEIAAKNSTETPGKPATLKPKVLLESLAASLSNQGIDVATQIDCVDPLHEGLLQHTRNSAADLVIKDTHHHSFLKRSFITNTDWYLIRGCAVPLLLTKPLLWHKHPAIFAAVDPGHTNDKPATLDRQLLEWTVLLAKKLDGSVHVAHAYIPASLVAAVSTGLEPMVGAITEEMMQTENSAKRKEIDALVRDYAVDAANIHLQLGSADEFLPRITAEHAADILVTGAVARSGLGKLFIGSTAEQILERTACDLLIVKPLQTSSELRF